MVAGAYTPTVILHINPSVTQCDHRLDCDTHTLLELGTVTATTVIGNAGILMHFTTYAMTDKLTNYAISMALAVRLYGKTYVTETLTGYSLFYTKIERLLSDLEQFPYLRIYLTYCKSVC